MVMILCATILSGVAAWLFLRPGNAGHGARAARPGSAAQDRHPWFPFRRAAPDAASDAEEYAKLIRQLSALLRAGCSNTAALALLEKIWADAQGNAGADIHAGCTRALTQMRTGGMLRTGLAEHAATSKHHSRLWGRLAWCFAISEQSGAALAELLDQLAAELESAADMRRALDAALAGPRATSRLLTFLPLVGVGLGQLLGINPLAVLTMHPVGRMALLAGVLLWLANRWWCHLMLVKIVRRIPS